MFGINEIEVHQLQSLLDEAGDDVHLVDVRSPMEVAQGVIPGAKHIPLHMLPFQLEQIPDDKRVVFYCRTGARSGQACLFANSQGKGNTLNLRGGIMAWVQGGRAVA